MKRILDGMQKTMMAVKPPRYTALEGLQKAETASPFKILIGTVLSARTRDENTTKAVTELFKVYNTPQKLAKAKAKNIEKIIHEIFSYAESNKCKIFFPKDVKVGKNLNDKSVEKEFVDIEDNDMILDVGSKTLVEIKKVIDNSSTLLWNGPLGYFENENFSLSSSEVANYIANKGDKIFSVVGGGDTVALINSLNIKSKFNFVSTAGGAFLEFLEGKNLPGIKALN